MKDPKDKYLYDLGFNKIAGIDEVGRGALSSIVAVGCVILPKVHKIEGIKDSKKFSGPNAHTNRQNMAALIQERALFSVIYQASNETIDEIGVHNAVRKCMWKCMLDVDNMADIIVIDGKYSFEDFFSREKNKGDDNFFRGEEKSPIKTPYICEEKADNDFEAVAASSVIAKSYRDELMIKLSKQYPEYNWQKNKGYGTKDHKKAIEKYGLTPLHRRSFTIK